MENVEENKNSTVRKKKNMNTSSKYICTHVHKKMK